MMGNPYTQFLKICFSILDLSLSPMGKLAWIIDITIAYPDKRPLDLPTILLGYRQPCKTVMFYRVYRSDEVPQDTDAMTHWLYRRFEEKERILDSFYKTGKIPAKEFCTNPQPPQVIPQDYLRFAILHLFFITSTYVHVQLFLTAYEYYNFMMQ